MNHDPVTALYGNILIFLHKDEKLKISFSSEDHWQVRNLKRFCGRRDQGSRVVLWLTDLAKTDYFDSSGFSEDWKSSTAATCQATFPAPGNKRRAVLP